RLIEAMPRPVAELIGLMKSATDWRTPKMRANTIAAATMTPSWRRFIATPSYDVCNIARQKNSADQRARRFTDTFGQLRIIYRPREHQRTDQCGDDSHRLLVRGALTPFGELLLDEPDQLLDPPAHHAPHF